MVTVGSVVVQSNVNPHNAKQFVPRTVGRPGVRHDLLELCTERCRSLGTKPASAMRRPRITECHSQSHWEKEQKRIWRTRTSACLTKRSQACPDTPGTDKLWSRPMATLQDQEVDLKIEDALRMVFPCCSAPSSLKWPGQSIFVFRIDILQRKSFSTESTSFRDWLDMATCFQHKKWQ